MTGIQPELWVDRAGAAVTFYEAAFGARVSFDAPAPGGGRYLHVQFGAAEDGPTGAGIWLLRATGGDESRVGRQTGGETGRQLLDARALGERPQLQPEHCAHVDAPSERRAKRYRGLAVAPGDDDYDGGG